MNAKTIETCRICFAPTILSLNLCFPCAAKAQMKRLKLGLDEHKTRLVVIDLAIRFHAIRDGRTGSSNKFGLMDLAKAVRNHHRLAKTDAKVIAELLKWAEKTADEERRLILKVRRLIEVEREPKGAIHADMGGD